jgi:hypothetical protein
VVLDKALKPIKHKISYLAVKMIIQTTLSDLEYQLLEQYAKANGKSIDVVVHEAIRAAIEDSVNPSDPIFACSSSS